MFKYIAVLIVGILTSFYYFPFAFTFAPALNTKLLLACIGLVLLIYNMSQWKTATIDKDYFIISLFALGVSFASLLSMTLNETPDNTYLWYIISMWVWSGAGYLVVQLIKRVHGCVSVELLCRYMIAVGVCQCMIAVTIDNIPIIKEFVYSFLAGEGFMGKAEGRTHGIGCGLDVGGARLAVLLVMIAFLLPRVQSFKNYKIQTGMLLISYGIILVIGNMIGRTTITGGFISLGYIIYMLFMGRSNIGEDRRQFLAYSFMFSVIVVLMLSIALYSYNEYWREQFRFGFEGFFSLVEVGSWEVHSNDLLVDGLVFPDNSKTWLIGDGYMADPNNDIYYIGETTYGFYKNTDVGYSRFLFYFGLIGLTIFSLFFVKTVFLCLSRFMQYKMMFLMILALCFIVWIKATSDLFPALAAFLCISKEDNDAYESGLMKSV